MLRRRNLLHRGGGGSGGDALQLRGPLANWSDEHRHQNRNLDVGAAKTTAALPAAKKPTGKELELGIREGRSSKCVSVDRSGMADSKLDLGVMRNGDVLFADTSVEMKLDLIRPDIVVRGRGQELQGHDVSKSLSEMILERYVERYGRVLQSRMPVHSKNGVNVYLMEKDEKEAIGIVTAEVSTMKWYDSWLGCVGL